MDSKISQREQWTSKLGFILAAAGSAVGLGNLWGFAYRASQGGGAAFVLLYILIVLIVCLPVFVAEMALGRNAMASTLLCLLYTSPSPRDYAASRMPSSA